MSRTTKRKKFVIVRTVNAGVHVGFLVRQVGQEVELEHANRVWQWQGANTLNELSIRGADMNAYTRISEPTPGRIKLLDAIEVIETSEDARVNLSTPRWL